MALIKSMMMMEAQAMVRYIQVFTKAGKVRSKACFLRKQEVMVSEYRDLFQGVTTRYRMSIRSLLGMHRLKSSMTIFKILPKLQASKLQTAQDLPISSRRPKRN